MTPCRKLIEVALPLEDINVASAREKSIRQGHPSTLHLWWARRPLAAARAVLFSQMVDDPSGYSEELRMDPVKVKLAEKALGRKRKGEIDTAIDSILIEQERDRLFVQLRDLVKWENTTNEAVLEPARVRIRESWRRTCKRNGQPETTPIPAFHDPFAGGGAIPLEAQRLGLVAYASDLNPVAVLINKAMIEIPPRFAAKGPVHSTARSEKGAQGWPGASGLAEDVRRYGKWMRDEALRRIGHLYPRVEVTKSMAKDRPDLKSLIGQKLLVVAWLWARTVKSPNPAFADIEVPLVSSFWLSTKAGKEAYVEPVIRADRTGYDFFVRTEGKPRLIETVNRGGGFCILSETPMPFKYLRAQAAAGKFSTRLMAVVAEVGKKRVYLSPSVEMENSADRATPEWKPEVLISHWPGRTNVVEYGMTSFGDLFTPRQLVTLSTLSELVQAARKKIESDALTAGWADDRRSLDSDGCGARAYAEAVSIYLGMGVSRLSDICNSLCRWETSKTQVRNLFGRQAIPMIWDFAEPNVFAEAAGDFQTSLGNLAKVVDRWHGFNPGKAEQSDASTQSISQDKVVSTDPPYYDNIGYADLSDFFYVWLRHSLKTVLPGIFSTLAVPKKEELVASPYRHGGKSEAERFFLDGMTQAMHRLAEQAASDFPVTIYYAFKQSETTDDGISSAGWATFLQAVLKAGFSIVGTWPMNTELENRPIGSGANALASSIVLVCRKRVVDAPMATRSEFGQALKRELPNALKALQHGNVAPVDLPQSSIGPGMAIFSRYAKIIEADGGSMSVQTALQIINAAVDEFLSEQEAQMDEWTRFAVTWFTQNGFKSGAFGAAQNIATARGVSVDGVREAGIIESGGGKVRILRPKELPEDWDPAEDSRLTVWEVVHQLIRTLDQKGESDAARLLRKVGALGDDARALCYRLYTICEQKKWAEEARDYNTLITAWPELTRLALASLEAPTPTQGKLL